MKIGEKIETRKASTIMLITLLLFAGTLQSGLLLKPSFAHPCPGYDAPLWETKVFLEKIILKGDHDDGLNGDTELIVLGNASLVGHQQTSFSVEVQFDNDEDGDDSKTELLFHQMILYHVTCSPPPAVEVTVLLFEDDSSSGVLEAILQILKTIAGAIKTPTGKAIQFGISIAEILAKLFGGGFLNPNDFLGGVRINANPGQGTSTASGTTSETESTVEISIERRVISQTCEEPECQRDYKNATYYEIQSIEQDKELYKEPLEQDLENLNSHLNGSHYFNPDLFSNGTAAIGMLPYINISDTESWTEEELEFWKADFTAAVTDILKNSTITVYNLALLFGDYTEDPRYSEEMQSANQEFTDGMEDLTIGNVTSAYEHFYASWQHSWNAMLIADTTVPHMCISSEKSFAWLNKIYKLGAFCSYDIAGPVRYECLKEFIWDFGDGFADLGMGVEHIYTKLGTYQVTLFGVDRSYNLNTTSTQVRVTIRQDIDGNWKVDIKDIAKAAKAFGSYPGNPRWNKDVDINDDNKIDIKDIASVARQFGWFYRV